MQHSRNFWPYGPVSKFAHTVVACSWFALCGCLAPVHTPWGNGDEAGPTVTIYLVDHGWHTGLVVPTDTIPAGWIPERRDFPDAAYLEFGWGDRDFYRAAGNRLWAALKAAFWPTGSVLHVAGLRQEPQDYFMGKGILRLDVSETKFERLCRFLHYNIIRPNTGPAVAMGPGLYARGQFYRAKGAYFLTQNCNHWTALALRSAGLPIRPNPVLTADGLLQQARHFGTVVTAGE